ncbi:MAG: alpha/beta hydrolase [Acidobacteria bacterium]|nr:alpha/beta hydrolase [Acidobacteriota bacterium]MDA1235388.1 alpha/beta hydrolase [Acidobacteriota bacterium]
MESEAEFAEFQKLNAVMTFLRNRNSADYAVTSPNGIDESKYVQIGGIEQWITVRGQDRRNPVLLFLHGGPGDAVNPWGCAGFRSWLKRFTVVQWDQRGAGRTLGRNGADSASRISLERMVEDGIELSELLRKDLKKDKVVLLGHSWGSILGLYMAKARPAIFYAFVGTGQVADPAKNYNVAYADLLAKAKRLGGSAAIRELEGIGPPPYADGAGYAVQRKWSNRFEGADFFLSATLGLAFAAPGYGLGDVNDWIAGQGLSAAQLVPKTSVLTPEELGGEFALPVFVIQGAEDFTTPTGLAKRFVKSIRAPRKAFVEIERGGHFAVFMKPDAFLKELTAKVLPLTR